MLKLGPEGEPPAPFDQRDFILEKDIVEIQTFAGRVKRHDFGPADVVAASPVSQPPYDFLGCGHHCPVLKVQIEGMPILQGNNGIDIGIVVIGLQTDEGIGTSPRLPPGEQIAAPVPGLGL
ncbi:MAG: hypothetical protein ACD_75C00964G0001 [uncultured bacterium]|nr:MAG: hypothetical protein ACD_75C00964G0001 [uncultured bacterium]